jgi:hypothetical protein
VGKGVVCGRLKTGWVVGWWGHAHARPGGGKICTPGARGSVLPTPIILIFRPNCASPHTRCVAPIRDARIGHDVCTFGGVGLSATHLRARLSSPLLYSPFSECPCAMGFAAWGSTGGRTREGCFPLCAPQLSRRLHTIIDAAASCIGGIAERSRGGARDGLRSAAPAMVRRTYIDTGGNVGGQVRCCCCASGCMGSCGVECTAAVHGATRLRATERGGWRWRSIWQCHGQRRDSARRRRARRRAGFELDSGDAGVGRHLGDERCTR